MFMYVAAVIPAIYALTTTVVGLLVWVMSAAVAARTVLTGLRKSVLQSGFL